MSRAKAIALLVLLGLLAYCNAFGGSLQLDDYLYIPAFDYVNNFADAYAYLRNRPVIAGSIYVNQLLGGSLAGYHALNLAVHVLAGLTLFGIVGRTLELPRWQGRFRGREVGLAFAVAAIWLVHPLNTGAVTYLIQRCESMMGLCYLACIYFLLRGATGAPGWYALGIACGVVGSGCKETMLTAPFLVLLFDRVFLAESWGDVWRQRKWVHLGYFLVLVFPLMTRLPGVVAPTGVASGGFVLRDFGTYEYLLTQPGVILRYLKLALLPTDLCFDYRDWPIVRNPLDALPSLALVLTLLGATLYGVLRATWWGFLGAWFFGVLAMSSSIFALLDVCCEYRMYLSLAAVVVGAVLAGDAALRNPRVASCVLAVALVVLGGLTYRRNLDYQSGVTLWEDVLRKRPANFKAHIHLAEDFQRRGQWDSALKHHEIALAQMQPNFFTNYNLGALRVRQGKLAEGIALLEKSLEFRYEDARPMVNLGVFLPMQERWAEAEDMLERTLRQEPNNVQAHFYLANLLDLRYHDDEEKKARVGALIARGLELAPDWPNEARRGAQMRLRGGVFETRECFWEAFWLARSANLATEVADEQILFTLGWANERLGNAEEARRVYRIAQSYVAPDSPMGRRLDAKLAP